MKRAVRASQRAQVKPGDVVVFPPRTVHGIDIAPDSERAYCLQLMLPRDSFAEHVQARPAHSPRFARNDRDSPEIRRRYAR